MTFIIRSTLILGLPTSWVWFTYASLSFRCNSRFRNRRLLYCLIS